MDAIPHAIGLEGLENGVPQGVPGGDVGEGEGVGRIDEPVEVRLELDGVAVGDPEALPDGIAALDHAVQHVDAGLVAVNESIDPALGAGIAGVGLIEFGHQIARSRRCW